MNMAKSKGKAVKYIPPSTFSYEKKSCGPVKAESLYTVAKNVGIRTEKNINVKYLTGSQLQLRNNEKSLAGYQLLSGIGDAAIPVRCGGPFILLKPSSNGQSLSTLPGPSDYFASVYSIGELD
jgi:hypothetical protein